MDLYNYRPLDSTDSIRILVLKPKTSDDEVSFTLNNETLSKIDRFHALTYCWGSNVKAKRGLCDGETIHVTENLHSALVHLAAAGVFRSDFRRFWIDAVCINQEDDQEKSQQIPVMGKIYTSAYQTIVWLGDGTDGRDDAMQQINNFQRPKENYAIDTKTWDQITNRISPIFKNPRFHPLWVIQEVVLAKQIVVAVGHQVAEIEQLLDTSEVLISSWVYRNSPHLRAANNLTEIMKLRREPLENSNILDLTRKTQYFEMTDRRDGVYGMYGLVDGIDFPVDYHIEYSHADMFADFANWALRKFPDLAALSYARGAGNQYCKCDSPSWAPCFDTERLSRSLLEVSHFDAFGGQRNLAFKVDDKRNLHIAGAFVDTIQSIDLNFPRNVPRSFRDSYPSLLPEIQSYVLKMKTAVFAKCPTFSGARYRKFCEALTLGLDVEGKKVTEKTLHGSDEYVENIHSLRAARVGVVHCIWAFRRCFSVTTNDRSAWAPESHAKPGDRIYIFKGGRIPYIIRPRTDGTYTLVGECWVQGLMHGEALKLPGYKTETITLV